MKRISIFLSLAAVLTLLLAACNTAQPQPTEAVTSPAETAPAAEVTEAGGAETEPAVTEETEEAATEAPTMAETAEVTEAAGGEATQEAGTETPEAGTGGTGGTGSAANQPQLTTIMHYPVKFANSSIRGSIEDFVLDLNGEQIAYALVSIDSPAAGGERVVPVPWNAFVQNPDDSSLSLGFNLVVDQDAPTVDPEAGLDFTDPEWDQDIRAYWANRTPTQTEGEAGTATPSAGGSEATATPGTGGAEATGTPEAGGAATATATPGTTGAEETGTPAAAEGTEEPGTAGQEARYILASNVLDASVYFSAAAAAEATPSEGTPAAPAAALGQALGRVEDVSTDPAAGKLLFASVVPNQSLGLAENVWVPVPVRLLASGPRPGTLALALSADSLDLQSLPTIDPNQLPDLTQPEWLDQFRSIWESINQ